MKVRTAISKTVETQKSHSSSSPLVRQATAAKQRRKHDDVTAAMEVSQRKGAIESSPKISVALVRTVQAAKLRRKKEAMTAAMEESQRDAALQRKPQSEALARTVAAHDRLRAKTAVTAAMSACARNHITRGDRFCPIPLKKSGAGAHRLDTVVSATPPQAGTRRAILRRFCAVAARRNSSFAPRGPRNRRRSSFKIRFRCANAISTFFRCRRDTTYSSVSEILRATSRASSCTLRKILRCGRFGQHCCFKGHASQSTLRAR